MSGYNADPALSHNVMGQITGSEKPNEVITIGGHIDSWDIGMVRGGWWTGGGQGLTECHVGVHLPQGAMDDAGGLFCCLEALRVMKALGLRPKRTVRTHTLGSPVSAADSKAPWLSESVSDSSRGVHQRGGGQHKRGSGGRDLRQGTQVRPAHSVSWHCPRAFLFGFGAPYLS